MATLFNRIVLLVIFSTLVLPNVNAQSLVWTQTIVGVGASLGASIAGGDFDAEGNLYTTGGFGGTVNFGGGSVSLTAVSAGDMFIMKEDPSGNLIWVKQVKGLSSGVFGCGGRGEVDDNGNVYIIGAFRDSFDFDPGPALYKLNSHGSDHAFILKLDSAGDFVWVKDIGTQIPSVYIQATTAKRDKNGNLYFAALLVGNGATAMDVDPGPGVYNITPSLGDLLIEKLDSNGNFVWAKQITGDNAKIPRFLDFDSSSNVFVSGTLLGSADFDPGPGVYTLTASPATPPFISPHDIFVAKYDSSGNFVWAHSFGSGWDDLAWGGEVDCFGNVFLTGGFGGTVDFDPGPGVHNLTAASTRSLFTLKLKNNGDFSWVKMGGASSGSYVGVDVTTDSAGNVYTAMSINGSCDLDPGAGVYNVPSGAAVQKLDSAGNFVWGAGFQADNPRWIGLDNKDSVYVCGDFSGVKDFDPGLNTYFLSANGLRSGFILKLSQTPLPNGVEGMNRQAEVSVYPNPSSGLTTFSSSFVIKQITLTDIAGRIVYKNRPNRTKTIIDLSNIAAGVYFYEVDCGAGKQRGKLVIY